jgi:predicted phage terminase large subunit-like protein
MIIDLKSIDAKLQLIDINRAECEDSLYEFLRNAWHIFDPAPWIDGWCVEAMAEHLQAVCDGEIRRLIINIPPRCAKSALCSVAFPAWTWAQQLKSHTSGPGASFLYASFREDLSRRDSLACRRIIESDWYKQRWGDRYALSDDQNTKSKFNNNQGGFRLITSIESKGATGDGSSLIFLDDCNSAKEVESEAIIASTLDWFDGTLGSRLNNQKLGAVVEIQQRLGENDITGHILSKSKGDWVHLCLPMRYEPERSFHTVIGWKDPRTEPGELLWPERFGEPEVVALETWMGEWRAAGQLQQRPEPRGGGVIKRDWWKLWERDAYPAMDFVLGCLDTAYTLDQMNDPSGMIVWGIFSSDVMAGESIAQATRSIDKDGRPMYINRTYGEGSPRVMMMMAWEERLELHQLVKKVEETCRLMKVDLLLVENKAAGISVSQELRRLFGNASFGVQLSDPKSQDKFARLVSVQHLFQEGLIYAPDRKWADDVITQVGQFPRSRHDEYVDCTSMGLKYLREGNLLTRPPEREIEMEALKQYPGRQQSLYNC